LEHVENYIMDQVGVEDLEDELQIILRMIQVERKIVIGVQGN
jgi:hypothetical protein